MVKLFLGLYRGNFIVYGNLVTELSIIFSASEGALRASPRTCRGRNDDPPAPRLRNGQDRSLQSVGANCVRPLDTLQLLALRLPSLRPLRVPSLRAWPAISPT